MKAIPVLLGLSAVLGVYLWLGSSGAGVNLIGFCIGLFGIASIALYFFFLYRRKKELLNLQRQLTDFLEGKLKTPAFSVNDDDFAMFVNAVVELETRLLLEKENTKKECKHNADFIADVSHQLKTPLAAMKLFCELDCASSLNVHAVKQLELVEHMENLIYKLLRLEKLRADAYEMNFESCLLSGIVQAARDELTPLYNEKNIVVSGDAVMRCDADWMGEAVLNILKNACEHTHKNGCVNISIQNSEASVTLVFHDDGGGVPESDLPKLFKRFSRVTAGTGAGLGLSIAKEIVEKHHGTVYAENAERGLRIILCFPILDGVLAV